MLIRHIFGIANDGGETLDGCAVTFDSSAQLPPLVGAALGSHCRESFTAPDLSDFVDLVGERALVLQQLEGGLRASCIQRFMFSRRPMLAKFAPALEVPIPAGQLRIQLTLGLALDPSSAFHQPQIRKLVPSKVDEQLPHGDVLPKVDVAPGLACHSRSPWVKTPSGSPCVVESVAMTRLSSS